MNIISTEKALKARSVPKPMQAAIDKFKNELNKFWDQSKNNLQENEEFHKNLLKDLLKIALYADNFFINTKGNIDLVIHNGKDPKTPVGVIIELKRPNNKAEMVNIDNLNAKAMQQVLLYYFEEIINKDNKELKHIIITNINEWFIFDAHIFYQYFFNKNQLVNEYEAFKDGLLVSKTNDFFYENIASHAIEQVKNNFKFTYFKITDENIDEYIKDENKLINLYKILSPHYLLKIPSPNDNNTLNQNFYAELLYIIGLSEENEGSKKVIVRSKGKERKEGSLLEMTLFQLSDDLQKRDEFFEPALELTLTWINRLLFLKLLETQQIQYQNGNSDYAFLNIDKVKDFNDLDTLFFKVLAIKSEDRDGSIKKQFENVPYLNSSLFDPIEKEKRLRISNLDHKKTIEVFSGTVLKNNSGNKLKEELNTLKYIFEFLNAYDFSSEYSDKTQKENKTLINASVLGLIFEKINGYKDGSYFTPGFITSYICRETIRRAVVDKFNEKKSWNAEIFDDLKNHLQDCKNTKDIIEANKIINSITICDPAVGSGHFLVSALNEIISIKSDFGILANSKGVRLNCTAEVINDELVILDKSHNLYTYNFNDSYSRNIQETIFQEKQRIIEGSLFGVDINPNSVKICRLRLWIELLKHTYYTKESNYTKLETLPNLDINIKCGDSLISRFELDIDLKKELKKLNYTVKDYQEAVNKYKNATDKNEKKDMEELIEKIKNNFKSEVEKNSKLFKRKHKLQDELEQGKLFEDETKKEKCKKELKEVEHKIEDINNNEIYKNAFEWRFEFPEVLDDNGNFIGFDVVIGNPPYIEAKKLKEISPLLKDYFVFTGTSDLSVYFIERGLKISKSNGYLCFITTNKFYNTGYGKPVRKILIENQIIQIMDFEQAEVFENALVSSAIIGTKKTKAEIDKFSYQKFYKLKMAELIKQFVDRQTNFGTYCQSSLTENEWSFSDNEQLKLKEKIENVGIKICDLEGVAAFRGVTTGYNPAFIIDNQTKNELIAVDKKNKDIIKSLLQGRNIRKWIYHESNENLLFIPWHFPLHLDQSISGSSVIAEKKFSNDYPDIFAHLIKHKTELSNRNKEETGIRYEWYALQRCAASYYPEFEKCEKIIWGLTADKWAFAYDDKQHYLPSNGYILTSEKVSLKYLLALLNSNVLRYYFGFIGVMTAGGAYTLKHATIQQLPIVIAKNQKPIISLVNQILSVKKKNPATDTLGFERQIDELLYRLYGLTNDEIEIVEGRDLQTNK